MTQCNKMVSEPPHYLHKHQCSRTGTVQVGGNWFCKQHAEKAAIDYKGSYYDWLDDDYAP